MDDLKYCPVPHDHEAILKKAKKKKGFIEAYERLEEEYAVVHAMIEARVKSGLSQEKIAEKMGTKKSAVSRLESAGRHSPSLATLKKYANAVGCHLQIKFVPNQKKKLRASKTDPHCQPSA
jgi:ribosome-binding protein aMBF1 (putative translation factor)